MVFENELLFLESIQLFTQPNRGPSNEYEQHVCFRKENKKKICRRYPLLIYVYGYMVIRLYEWKIIQVISIRTSAHNLGISIRASCIRTDLGIGIRASGQIWVLASGHQHQGIRTDLGISIRASASGHHPHFTLLVGTICMKCQILFWGMVGWCEGVLYLTAPGRPIDIGLQLGKACYPCSR